MIRRLAKYRSFDDTYLVFLLMEGDRRAFDEIYERYWKRLYNDTYKRLKSIEKIEEIVQDVFSNLWTSRGKRNIQNIYPYLLTAVRYQVFMLYKKGKATVDNFIPDALYALFHHYCLCAIEGSNRRGQE